MDHNPIFFEEPMQLQKFGKPFQYFNFMADILGFLDTIANAWSLHCSGSPITKFNARLKQAKKLLRDLNKTHGNVTTNVLEARAKLEEIQVKMITDGDASLLILGKDLISKLNKALAKEEFLLLQKARIKWMGHGDGNNSFFTNSVKKTGIKTRFWSLRMNLVLLFVVSCLVLVLQLSILLIYLAR